MRLLHLTSSRTIYCSDAFRRDQSYDIVDAPFCRSGLLVFNCTGNWTVRCYRPPSSSVATSERASERTNPRSLLSSPLTLHLTVPTDFPHANAVDESPSFFSSSFSSLVRPFPSLQLPRHLPFSLLRRSFSLFSLCSRLGFSVGAARERGDMSCSYR